MTLDTGHPATLEHRAAVVGAGSVADPRAGYALGVLAIRDELADPESARPDAENTERLVAGARFAQTHAAAWGIHSPRSCLAAFGGSDHVPPAPVGTDVADIRKEAARARFFDMQIAAARTAPNALSVLHRTAIDGAMPQPVELPLLRRALAAIVAMR